MIQKGGGLAITWAWDLYSPPMEGGTLLSQIYLQARNVGKALPGLLYTEIEIVSKGLAKRPAEQQKESFEMLRLLGQQLLSVIFMKGGADAFLQPGGRVRTVAESGLPNPQTAVELNGVAMVVGGAMLALDIAPKLATVMLIGSLMPTTIVGHAFWKEDNEAVRKAQFTQFLKNLGIMGGLLILLVEKEEKRERRYSKQSCYGNYGASRRCGI